MSNGITATDGAIAAYNVVLAGAWLSVLDASSFASIAVLAHATAAVLPWLFWGRQPALRASLAGSGEGPHPDPGLARSERMPGGRKPGASEAMGRRVLDAMRELYPLVVIMIFWIELDRIIAALARPRLDGWVLAFDERVFGRHLHIAWPSYMSSPALGEAMNFAYFAYYLLIFLPPLVLYFGRRREALRDSMFRLMVAYLACYVFYLAFPAFGPRYTPGEYSASAGGVFGWLVERIHQAGDSRGTAFPSSHVAGAVTIALAGWRWFSRPVAVLFTIEAAAVVLSTVYTQNHYAIDSLVGLAGTLGLQLVLIPAALHIGRAIESRAALPVLPDFEQLLGAKERRRGAWRNMS